MKVQANKFSYFSFTNAPSLRGGEGLDAVGGYLRNCSCISEVVTTFDFRFTTTYLQPRTCPIHHKKVLEKGVEARVSFLFCFVVRREGISKCPIDKDDIRGFGGLYRHFPGAGFELARAIWAGILFFWFAGAIFIEFENGKLLCAGFHESYLKPYCCDVGSDQNTPNLRW